MCFVGIFVLSAYTFCRHLRFVGISVLSAYTFCWHKRFAGISVLSAYMLCRHIRFVGIYVLSAYMLCRHIRFVGIFVTNQQCQKRQLRKIKECWIMFTKPKLNSNRRGRMHLVPCMVIFICEIYVYYRVGWRKPGRCLSMSWRRNTRSTWTTWRTGSSRI